MSSHDPKDPGPGSPGGTNPPPPTERRIDETARLAAHDAPTSPHEPVRDRPRDHGVLVTLAGRGTPLRWLVPEGASTIGRGDGCELHFSDASLSRVHARVRRTGARFVLEDAGSTNGTYVNGARVSQAVLADGDHVRLGANVTLRFILVDEDERRALVATPDAPRRDPTTGALQRRHLEDRVVAEVARAIQTDGELSVLMVAIQPAETATGVATARSAADAQAHRDRLLREITLVATRSVADDGAVGRFSVDQLVIVMPGASRAQARTVAERIQSGVERLEPEGKRTVTVSIGIALFGSRDGRDAAALLACAEERVHWARAMGHNSVVAS